MGWVTYRTTRSDPRCDSKVEIASASSGWKKILLKSSSTQSPRGTVVLFKSTVDIVKMNDVSGCYRSEVVRCPTDSNYSLQTGGEATLIYTELGNSSHLFIVFVIVAYITIDFLITQKPKYECGERKSTAEFHKRRSAGFMRINNLNLAPG
jgi:hypothetical protein